jgi:hypothetical protein
MVKTTDLSTEGTRRDAAARSRFRRGDPAEKPPESAEDFAHVLRRLMAARATRTEGNDEAAE